VRVPVVPGLDVGGTKIAAAVADLEGNRLAEGIAGTEPVRGVRWNFNQGVQPKEMQSIIRRDIGERVTKVTSRSGDG